MPPLERPQDLQVLQPWRPGKVAADLGLLGRLARQVPVADRVAIEPGNQQQPIPALLPGQVVGEEVALPEDRHQRGKVGMGRWPDLHGHGLSLAIPRNPSSYFPGWWVGADPRDTVTALGGQQPRCTVRTASRAAPSRSADRTGSRPPEWPMPAATGWTVPW
jgi:hypothetical protein